MELTVRIKKKLGSFLLDADFVTGDFATGLLGASGSGKSMILKCIAGLETPDSGQIVLNGRVLFDSEKRINLSIQKRKIGYLFQNYALFPHMTIYENIGFGLNKLNKEERDRRIKEKIKMIQLTGLADRYPHQLSGGQQQRVALARALAIEPEVLLLDEPFSALDNHLKSQVEKELIESLKCYNGVTLFVTHNMDEAYRVCKDLVVLSQGKVIAGGDKENLFHIPPNIICARLTGCKNFSEVRALSDSTAEAVNWGCALMVAKPIPLLAKHIAIRANHLKLTDKPDMENTFLCRITGTSETPFRITIYLKLYNSNSDRAYDFQLETAKEKWNGIKVDNGMVYVHFDPNRLFLLED